jgi:hypothetical protein
MKIPLILMLTTLMTSATFGASAGKVLVLKNKDGVAILGYDPVA